MKILALLIFMSSMAQAAPAHMQLGDYQGVDQSGRFCDLYLGHQFGEEQMGFFWFLNESGSYRVGTQYDPQPTPAGKIQGSANLIADGSDYGRPLFREVFGAPIGVPVIFSKFTIHTKNRVPVRLDFETDYGKSVCKNLKYTGPYRP